jgi:hypothetical protein
MSGVFFISEPGPARSIHILVCPNFPLDILFELLRAAIRLCPGLVDLSNCPKIDWREKIEK